MRTNIHLFKVLNVWFFNLNNSLDFVPLQNWQISLKCWHMRRKTIFPIELICTKVVNMIDWCLAIFSKTEIETSLKTEKS